MPWPNRSVSTVASGADSARIDLLPGEWAHVEVKYTSTTTERMLVRIFSTNADSGVAEILSTNIPSLEFRIEANETVPLIVADVRAFVVAIDNDVGAQSLTAEVRVAKSGVDLTT